MNQEIQKAIELIEKSEYIILFLPEKPNTDLYASAEILSRVLKTRGKHVGFAGNSQKTIAETLPTLASLKAMPKEFIIAVDTKNTPVSELRYETREDGVDIILSPKSSPLDPEMLSFKEGKTRSDLAIAIGISSPEDMSRTNEINPEFFTETPLINIDNNEKNARYGEVNIVGEKKPSLSEIIYTLITHWPDMVLEKDGAETLLSGIVFATDSFRNKKTGAETLLASSELMRSGAALPPASKTNTESSSLSLVQLAGRASIRSRINQHPPVVWSFLTAEDFEKTGRGVTDVSFVLDYLEQNIPAPETHALLWQDPGTKRVSATLYGAHETLEAIRLKTPGEFQSPHLKLSLSFDTFRDAEEKVSALLKGVL